MHHQPAATQKPVQHDANRSGETLYPYEPTEYQQLHIVGHTLENGEHLPIKVFVDNYTMPGVLPFNQPSYWKGVLHGAVCALVGFCGLVVLMEVLLG